MLPSSPEFLRHTSLPAFFSRLRRLIPLLALLCLSLLGRASEANTLTVPSQYATIQAAINASVNGDTVLISTGTYTGPGDVDLDFGGRNITVTSVNGPANTIIDCQGSSSANHRGFYLHSGETSAVISGLTIKNGYESSGSGGGIDNVSVGVTVQNCVLSSNTAGASPGGGGGIANVSGSSPITITGCTFTGNAVNNNGGGIFNDNEGSGGITVKNCIFTGNTAPNNSGGGIFSKSLVSSTVSVTNCALAGNSASYGGGLYVSARSSGAISVTNCTLTGNSATTSGGVYTALDSGSVTFTNDIVYGDTGGEISGSGITFAYCDIQGGYTGTAIVNAGPLFVSGTQPYNLHLLAGSPCLGAGTSSGAPTTTIDGVTRPSPPAIGAYEGDTRAATTTTLASSLNPSAPGQSVTFTATVTGSSPTGTVVFIVDGTAQPAVALSGASASYSTASLGVGPHTLTAAYGGDGNNTASTSPALTQTVTGPHVSPQYVSPSGNDSNSGTQASPKLTIQAAINATFSGDMVIVEDGTYTGPGNVDLDLGGRNVTVTSQNGAATTIIDCGGSSGANHRGFYLHSGETNAVISGLTVQNGYETNKSGGGIYSGNVGVSIQFCVFKNNIAVATSGNAVFGGGIESYTSTSNNPVLITKCTFTGNSATNNGGGMEIDDRNTTGVVTVNRCTFTNNSSLYGGGMDIYGTGANSVINCTFTGNTAINEGGGIYNQYNNSASPISITNCVFTGNSSPLGGGIYSYNGGNSTISVTNCTLTGNTATNAGGGFYDSGSGAITLTNDIAYSDIGGEMAGVNVNAINCDIQGGYAGTNVLSADPLFVSSPTDLHLLAGSPCLGAGTPNGAPATTRDGYTRPNPPSIGAYELDLRTATTTTLTSSLNPSMPGPVRHLHGHGQRWHADGDRHRQRGWGRAGTHSLERRDGVLLHVGSRRRLAHDYGGLRRRWQQRLQHVRVSDTDGHCPSRQPPIRFTVR